jgi:chromosome segregation ATPase
MQTVNKSLYERVMDFKEVATLEIPEGASPEQVAELEARWQAEFDARFQSVEEKVNAYYHAIKREEFKAKAHQPQIDAIREELAMLEAAAARHEKEAERIEARLVQCLRELGTEVIAEGKVFKAIKNGGKPRLELDSANIPPEYYYTPVPKPEIDKETIRLELEAGKQLPFAKLAAPTYRLGVKGE